MLAYDPGFGMAFDIRATLVSSVFPVTMAALGWRLVLDRRPVMWLCGGGVTGIGAAGMPFLGMWSLRAPAHIAWNHDLAAISVGVSVGLAALAAWLHRRQARAGIVAWVAGSMLTVAICGGAFLIRAAAQFQIKTQEAVSAASTFGVQSLTILLVIVALGIMGLGITLIVMQERANRDKLAEAQERSALAEEIMRGAQQRELLTAELQKQIKITEAAIEHMPQGLSMYDAENRLVICNSRYGELHGIPLEMLKPGVRLLDLCEYMFERGAIPDIPDLSATPGVYDPESVDRHEILTLGAAV
jgi:NO-binding membrane sensor protein with MHYT domain